MTFSEPKKQPPNSSWEHFELFRNVREAVYSLPLYFRTETNIEGISATDIFTLNSALGATIENQVVSALNQMRPVWDTDEKYQMYSFTRQSQTFPDVLLKKVGDVVEEENDIIMGIELKGWYILAKEGEPSFRFQATADACAFQDLIVVVPWALNNVISGSPKVFVPYVEFSRYAAEYRNYHWTSLRQTRSDTTINIPDNIKPYPKKSDPISDKPVSDSGGNFGRFARTGIMDRYLLKTKRELISGISAENWLAFFKIFQDQKDKDEIKKQIEKMRNRVSDDDKVISDPNLKYIAEILDCLENLVND